MATQTTVTLIDDIDGSDAAETVEFALDGASYEIDLNEKNAKKLRDAVANYVAHARHVGAGSAGGRRSGARRGARAAQVRNSREQLQAIREWARKQGYEVSDRGRIAAGIVEAFEDAH